MNVGMVGDERVAQGTYGRDGGDVGARVGGGKGGGVDRGEIGGEVTEREERFNAAPGLTGRR